VEVEGKGDGKKQSGGSVEFDGEPNGYSSRLQALGTQTPPILWPFSAEF